MREFLQALFESGHVSVAARLGVEGEEDVTEVIKDFDRVARLNLAPGVPALDEKVARWAAGLLYRACQMVVLRSVEAAEMEAIFRTPCPATRSPETAYSADLFFRYLPDVHEMAKRLAADDPLVAHLAKLGTDWPLSSTGMKGIERGEIGSFISNASLRQLYIDRIIENKAFHLAREPEMAEEIRAILPESGGEGDQVPVIVSTV